MFIEKYIDTRENFFFLSFSCCCILFVYFLCKLAHVRLSVYILTDNTCTPHVCVAKDSILNKILRKQVYINTQE